MKKILILNYEFPPLGGGAANATYYLLKEFSKYNNLEIDLVTSSVSSFKQELFADNVTIHYLDIGKGGNLHYQSNKDLLTYSFRAFRYAKKLNQKKKFDLVHAFFGIPCGFIAMLLKIPYIVSLRGSDVPFYNERFYWLDKFIFSWLSKLIWARAKHVVANSQGLKELALKTNPAQAIDVIYNGVDTNEFSPDEHKTKNEKMFLVSTGRLIARKGYNYLIDALKDMKGVELWLVGDGNLKDELEAQAKQNQVEVKFLGKKEHYEIPQILKQSDIFVLPSLNEGMSNSVLEAMACGLPVIATDTGGTAELIKGNGFIVDKESSESIKKVLGNYTAKPSLILEQGVKSRALAESMSWVVVAKQYYEKYAI